MTISCRWRSSRGTFCAPFGARNDKHGASANQVILGFLFCSFALLCFALYQQHTATDFILPPRRWRCRRTLLRVCSRDRYVDPPSFRCASPSCLLTQLQSAEQPRRKPVLGFLCISSPLHPDPRLPHIDRSLHPLPNLPQTLRSRLPAPFIHCLSSQLAEISPSDGGTFRMASGVHAAQRRVRLGSCVAG